MIFVTGLLRSGTSMLAGIVHHLGIPMGTEMVFPLPGLDPEYEDIDLAIPLTEHAMRRQYIRDTSRFFSSYAARRLRTSGVVLSPFVKAQSPISRIVWGVKSPFLLSHTKVLAELFPEATWFQSIRDPGDCADSIRRVQAPSPHRMTMLRLQRELLLSCHGLPRTIERPPNVTGFHFDDLRERPYEVATRIAEQLGVVPTVLDVDRAIRHIRVRE